MNKNDFETALFWNVYLFYLRGKKIVALLHILKTKKKKKNNKFKNSSKKDYNIIYTNNSLIYMPNK